MAATAMTLDGDREVVVVDLDDGRLGFLASDGRSVVDGAVVVLSAEGRLTRGSAHVVRSGPTYEEVRGRLRAEAGRWRRLRLRRDRPVVLVTPDGFS